MKLEEMMPIPEKVFRVFAINEEADCEPLGDYSLPDIAIEMAVEKQASEDRRKTGRSVSVIGNGAVLYPNCSLYGF